MALTVFLQILKYTWASITMIWRAWVHKLCSRLFPFVNVILNYLQRVLYFVVSKAKGRISKRVFQENKARKVFRKANISYPLIRARAYVFVSESKKCSFFGKPGVLCFLETPVLRFALCLITNNFLINKSMAFVTEMVLIVNLDFIVFRIKLRVSWGIELHLHKIYFKEMRATFRWIVSG